MNRVNPMRCPGSVDRMRCGRDGARRTTPAPHVTYSTRPRVVVLSKALCTICVRLVKNEIKSVISLSSACQYPVGLFFNF